MTRFITSISELKHEERRILTHGPACAQPRWFDCYEHLIDGMPDHLVQTGDEGDTRIKLIPFYKFERPSSIFTHNVPFLLQGGLIGNTEASHSQLDDLYPLAVSAPPYTYRYALSASQESDTQLSQTDIEHLEVRAREQGCKIISFLFIDKDQNLHREMLKAQGYTPFPVTIRWELDAGKHDSFETWLSSLKHSRRSRITRDISRAEKNDITVEQIGAAAIHEHWEAIGSLTKAHFKKYGFPTNVQQRVVDVLSQWVKVYEEDIVVFLARQSSRIVGYTACGTMDNLFYVKFPGYLPESQFAYFAATYYEPIKYAISKRLTMDFSIASDKIKRTRGLTPIVLWAYVKQIANGGPSISSLKDINRRHHQHFDSFTSNWDE